MDRKPDKMAGQSHKGLTWQSVLATALSVCCLAILAGFSWWLIGEILSQPERFPCPSIWLCPGFAILAWLVEGSLRLARVRRKPRHRLALLFPVGLIAVFWGWQRVSSLTLPSQSLPGEFSLMWLVPMLFSAGLGGFGAGLISTTFSHGFWENNSPPPEELRRAVHQLHLQRFGKPDHVPVQKRAFDIFLAGLGLLLSSPVWLLGAFLVWFEDPGPILFLKNSVGRGGRNFRQFKLRTMFLGAEDYTGPVPSHEGDERVLLSGKFLRKTALDELPQLVNILRGEMSFVGPRPQRTVLVYQYLQDMPEYADRHKVLPGLSGLAQVAGDYYLTPRQKLRFDRLYIRHTSLGFDLKLIILAFLVTFWFRWQKRWNGRLPRKLMRFGSP